VLATDVRPPPLQLETARRLLVETSGGRLLELDGIPGDEGESALLLVQDVTSREGGSGRSGSSLPTPRMSCERRSRQS
jgi:hypothetical protein